MRAVFLAIAVFLAAPIASAQPVGPELQSSGLTVAQERQLQAAVRRAARRAQASEAALIAVAQRMLELQQSERGAVDLPALLGALDRQASRVRELETRLSLLEGGDLETARLRQQAAAAVEEGRLAAAEALLLSAGERELAAASGAMERAASAFAASAQAAELQFAYSRSAPLWRRAAELAQDPAQRWRYRFAEATARARPDAPCDDDMCQAQLEPSGVTSISLGAGYDMLRQSVEMLEREVLPLAPREQRLSDWADTQAALARRYGRLCDMGGGGERTAEECALSLAAFAALFEALPASDDRVRDSRWRMRNLLSVFRISGDAAVRDRADRALASVINANASGDRLVLGKAHVLRGDLALLSNDDAGLSRGMAEHRRGAAVLRAIGGDDADWARSSAAEAQNRLGRHLQGVANQRGDVALWREAASAFEATLALRLPAADENRAFAAYQLATTFLFLQGFGEPFPFERSVQLLSSALEIYRRDVDPERWAVIQNNLGRCYEIRGNALRARGEGGDAAAFQASIAAYDSAAQHFGAALEIWTPGHANYAVAQANLSRVQQRNFFLAPASPAPDRALEPPERAGVPRRN
ncbi:MAG: hypothetical protein A4S17_05230 [Proteobacteria bacterium HN_bin10]|nr:MAG: hypothetical protein A4S17_05230 [Proteobacteria bacterium HN_bin10]